MQQFISLVGAWATVLSSIYVFFPKMERKLRPETKRSLSRWLSGKTTPDERWSSTFNNMFDRIFAVAIRRAGPVEIYMPSFIRSSIASVLAVLLFYFILFALFPRGASLDLWNDFGIPNLIIPYDLVVLIDGQHYTSYRIEVLFALPILVNLIPDYISLVQTRYVLQRLAHATTRVAQAGWILTDAALTFLLSYVAYVIMRSTLGVMVYGADWDQETEFYSSVFLSTVMFWGNPANNADSPTIYSTYMTSIWLWLFLTSAMTVKLLTIFPACVSSLNRWFNLDNDISSKPLSLLGNILMLVVTIGTLWAMAIT